MLPRQSLAAQYRNVVGQLPAESDCCNEQDCLASYFLLMTKKARELSKQPHPALAVWYQYAVDQLPVETDCCNEQDYLASS